MRLGCTLALAGVVALLGSCGFSAPRGGSGDGDADGDADGPADDIPTDDGTGDDDGPMIDAPPACAATPDHDEDGIGDDCDPCPHLRGPDADRDDDGDGVGNACDPTPGRADRRILFDGFYGTELATVWRSVGNWSVSGGFAQLGEGGGDRYLSPEPVFARLFVATHLEIVTFTGVNIGAGISLVRESSPSSELGCGVVNTVGGTQALLYRSGSGTPAQSQTTWSGPVVDVPLAITAAIDAEGARCTITGGGTQYPMTIETATPPGRFRVGSDGGPEARVDYVFLVAPAI